MEDLCNHDGEDDLKQRVKVIHTQLGIGKMCVSRLTRVSKRIQDAQKSWKTMVASRIKKRNRNRSRRTIR